MITVNVQTLGPTERFAISNWSDAERTKFQNRAGFNEFILGKPIEEAEAEAFRVTLLEVMDTCKIKNRCVHNG